MKRLFIFICVLFMFDAARAATLNIRHNGTTKQIELDTTKRTAPSLAMRVGNKTMYATMARTTTQKSGGMYVKYNNQSYRVLESVPESKFTITTTPTTNNFSFKMSAAGTFYVDWGDGVIDEIVRTNTTNTTYRHTYDTTGVHTIKMSGTATGYSTDDTTAAVSFNGNTNIAKIDGSLGMVFPTTGTNNQPRFYSTFSECANLGGTIPEKLFDGIYGQPVSHMFHATFSTCPNLIGPVPENLFVNLAGTPTEELFNSTFRHCPKLNGPIPENIFQGIQGAPKYATFAGTFSDSGFTGPIPGGLFSGIRGAPAGYMFVDTFRESIGLTSIEPGLFSGISGTGAGGMFSFTFYGCTGLRGELPVGLFGNIYGAPVNYMFQWTLSGCSNLSGPSARMPDGTPFYEYSYNGSSWFNNTLAFRYMYSGTNFSDASSIPSGWK